MSFSGTFVRLHSPKDVDLFPFAADKYKSSRLAIKKKSIDFVHSMHHA